MKFEICDVMMSINTESLDHKTWSIDRHNQGQYFQEIFESLEGLIA